MSRRGGKSPSGSKPAGSGPSEPALTYFKSEDVLHLAISPGAEASSVEITPNITAELNSKGELIGIEILSAAAFLRDAVLDSVQARVLGLVPAARPRA